ncbi:MAG: hypothetical protein M3Y86_08785 [Verrucomicrobiota bacterium]|nr:hypothetical protein [Verrucomicrobiota bacterium]
MQPVTTRRSYRWLIVPVMLLTVVLTWCAIYDRWTAHAWKTPIVYAGDAWWGLAYAKAISTGEIPLILTKYPHSLGAPFAANWNDYPSVEEGIAGWWGLLTRLFGQGRGENLALLSGYLFVAAGFYWACRELRYDRILAAAGAIIFSFSTYAIWRGVPHLGLVFYWHIPLGLVTTWWCLTKTPFQWRSRKGLLAAVIAVAFGLQNPYYSGIFLQLLVWAAVILLVQRRGWKRVTVPLLLCVIVFVTFFAMNLDTFYSTHVNGPNAGIVDRVYSNLELYSLKPLELVVPLVHRVQSIALWARHAYIERALFTGELGAAYLGVIGLTSAAFLLWKVIRAIARRNQQVPAHAWMIGWILLYSVAGGVNGFIGLFGMILFRGTNRYSIVILALLLLFGVRELTRLVRRRQWRTPSIALVAFLLVAVAIWDQTVSRSSAAEITRIGNLVRRDRHLLREMEKALPPDAMVFQLPVMDFPEVAPVLGLSSYEQFRPFLQSHHLRFSYGSDKGRTRERWQHEVENFAGPGLVQALEKYGFSAVLISKKGYLDYRASPLAALEAAGRGEVIAEAPEFVCVALHPLAQALLPPDFDANWYSLEGSYLANWRWARGNASIDLRHQGPDTRPVHVTFALKSIAARKIEIYFRGQLLTSIALQPNEQSAPIALSLNLAPGDNALSFKTDSPGAVPSGGDERILAFHVVNFDVE